MDGERVPIRDGYRELVENNLLTPFLVIFVRVARDL
jgi:hypothetical protein